jgi:hypothetical protein
MEKQPKEITICYLEVVLRPNGEIISNGKTLGLFKDYQEFIIPKSLVTINFKGGL